MFPALAHITFQPFPGKLLVFFGLRLAFALCSFLAEAWLIR